MTGATTSKPVTASDIYYAYPASDLLPIDAPRENESVAAYIERLGGRDEVLTCGDTLFSFILFELSDNEGPEECIHDLEIVLRDILSIKTAVEKKT
jgi:hypothetical protein